MSHLFLRRRSHLTLIEMMIVMVIIALVGGVAAININGALKEQRFRTEVSIVLDQLRLAQDLMLILNTDVHLKFAEEKESQAITYWLEFDYPLAPHWEKELKRKHRPLQAIHRVDFKEGQQTPQTRGQLDLKFLSGGSVMSQGTLILSTSSGERDDGGLTRYICLPGYPSPFRGASIKADDDCGVEADASFDEQMTVFTREEIALHASPESKENDAETPPDNSKTSPADATKKT